jgi:hypothetical protein
VEETPAPAVQVLADESTGFTWEGMFEEFLREYGDDGLSLYAFVTSRGWEVEKRSYGWVTARSDWWLVEGDKVLAIGDTAWGGMTYRTNANAAGQLYAGLEAIVAQENWLEEIELMIRDDYAELPWYARVYRFSTAVATNSVFSGIKNVENAIVGRTITDQQIGGWDRLKLGVVGSVETLLTVVPAAKGVTAVGGKLGAGNVTPAAVGSGVRSRQRRAQNQSQPINTKQPFDNTCQRAASKWSGRESNPRPLHCERSALPTELPPQR